MAYVTSTVHWSDPKRINDSQMHFSIYDGFYTQNSHQHVSAGIPAILRVILLYKNIHIYFFVQFRHMSFVDFVVLPPGHGRSVTDFWGWDAHETQLRCPDGVWVVIEEDVAPGGP